MAKLPCDIKAPCLDDANPIINLSSEGPDINRFYAYGSGPGSHSGGRTTGPGGVGPRPGGNWSDSCETADGPATCSATTQAEADLCVARLAQQCTPPPGTPPGSPTTPSGDPLFANRLQQCSAACPDGTPFIYTVPAGLFVATSQIVADREAHSYACRQASLARICFGALSNNSACVGQSFSSTITVTGGSGFTFTITNGSMPPGVTLSSSGGTALFSGTPTTAGVYSFTLTATNSRGNSISKTLTIGVLAFTNGAPPPYTVGTPYTFQFTAAGGTAPYVFTIASGALPPGLTMSTTGLISGTATLTETDAVSIKVTDAASRSCNKGYLITGNPVATGWRICRWADGVLPFFLDFTGCALSAQPPWNGVFDKVSTAGLSVNPFWYFLSQSVNGFAVAADADPAYLASPTWPDSISCFQLEFFAGQWILYLSCADASLPWAAFWSGQGTSTDSNDPSGVYTQNGGSALGPATITIVATTATGLTTPPDWSQLTWGVAGQTAIGTGLVSFTPNPGNGATFDAQSSMTTSLGNTEAVISNTGTISNFNSISQNGNLHLVITGSHFTINSGGDGGAGGRVQVLIGGFPIIDQLLQTLGAGTFDLPFNLATVCGSPKDIQVVVDTYVNRTDGQANFNASIHVIGTLSNVP